MTQRAQGNKGQPGPLSDRAEAARWCAAWGCVSTACHDQSWLKLCGRRTCSARLPSSNLPRLAGAASGAGPLGRAICRAARLLGCATSTGTACWHRTGARCVACGRAQLLRAQLFTFAPACAQTRAAGAYVSARTLQPKYRVSTNKKDSVTMSKRRLPVLREMQHCWRHIHKQLYQGRAPAWGSLRLEQTCNQQRAHHSQNAPPQVFSPARAFRTIKAKRRK